MKTAAPLVNTRLLFSQLLADLDVDTVCDIGSMDGSDALYFGQCVPGARIHAFEANPRNFALMEANPSFPAQGVSIEPLAVCDVDGAADFFVVRAAYPHDHARRGMSSLHRRDATQIESTVRVQTTRLDSFFRRLGAAPRRLALWIDVEGKAFEVIEGARGLWGAVELLHVEVESAPLIGTNQKVWRDVAEQLATAGFIAVATDFAESCEQFNALYVRAALAPSAHGIVQRRLRRAIWRRRLTNIVYRCLPGRARGYLAGRFRIRSGIA